MDVEPLDPSLYARPPVMNLEAGIALCRSLVDTCPKGASARVKKAAAKLKVATDAAQSALAKRQKALGKISDDDARLIDQEGDGSWGALRGRLQAYSMLPAAEYPDAARAGQILTILFGDGGLGFLKERYPVQWSTADTILKRIDDEHLQKDIDRIAGKEFLANIQKRHGEYGVMVKRLMTRGATDGVNLSDEVRVLGRAIVAYATQVCAAANDDDDTPEAIHLAREALRPLDVFREDASRRDTSSSSTDAPAAEPPAAAPPEK